VVIVPVEFILEGMEASLVKVLGEASLVKVLREASLVKVLGEAPLVRAGKVVSKG